jgi:chromosome segregation ATPase
MMTKATHKIAVMISIFLSTEMLLLNKLQAQDDGLRAVEWLEPQDYSEATLMKTNEEAIREKFRMEELERQAQNAQELYEMKRVDAERQTAEKRRAIEQYKQKQDQLTTDVETWRTELAQIESKQAEIEKELATVNAAFTEKNMQAAESRVALERTRSELNFKIEDLRRKKDTTFSLIEMANTEMGKWHQEITESQGKIIELHGKVSDYEKLALQIRSQALELQTKLTETKNTRLQAEQEMEMNRTAIAKAQSDFNNLMAEVKKEEAVKNQTLKKLAADRASYAAEMKRLEARTINANLTKAMAETENQRLLAETDNLKRQLAMVKAQSETVDSELASSNASLMQTRVSMQQIRSDLVRQLGREEKSHMKKEEYVQQMRSLASMANSSELTEGAKPWVVAKACAIRRGPASNAAKLGDLKVGERLYGSASTEKGWLKILNTSGSTAYVQSTCGQFQE